MSIFNIIILSEIEYQILRNRFIKKEESDELFRGLPGSGDAYLDDFDNPSPQSEISGDLLFSQGDENPHRGLETARQSRSTTLGIGLQTASAANHLTPPSTAGL